MIASARLITRLSSENWFPQPRQRLGSTSAIRSGEGGVVIGPGFLGIGFVVFLVAAAELFGLEQRGAYEDAGADQAEKLHPHGFT
jgi:hypothetical protein